MKNNQSISQQAEAAYAHLLSVFPSAQLFHQSPTQRMSVDQGLTQPLQALNRSERSIIFDKLRQIHKQPVNTLSQESILYLEQQLSDMYGLTLTTQSEQGSLPYLVGQIQAQSHLKTSPTDRIENHATVLEAGLRTDRSYFGWTDEIFGISLPLQELDQWSQLSDQQRHIFAHEYVVVINPVLEAAILAKIVDVGPYHTQRYQLGGTPQLIRDGRFWSPGCNGMAAIFFVETSSTALKTGLLSATM